MLIPPLYCSICSSPCELPRLPLPIPANIRDLHLDFKVEPQEWLRSWYALRISSGIIDPGLYLPLPSPSPKVNDGGLQLSTTLAESPDNSTSSPSSVSSGRQSERSEKRVIPIHAYCLSLMGRTIRNCQFSNAPTVTTHEETNLTHWSIPKWTGYAPWNDHNLTLIQKEKCFSAISDFAAKQDKQILRMMNPGYWGGLTDQRKRFALSGNHLEADDLVSPTIVASPKRHTRARSNDASSGLKRPMQHSKLLTLPLHLIERIIEFILNEPYNPPIREMICGNSSKSPTMLLDLTAVKSALSLLNTCSGLRYDSETPSSAIWIMLILDGVKKYRNELSQRWRANPTGVGSALHLWEALEEDFEVPVREAIQSVIHLQHQHQQAMNLYRGDRGHEKPNPGQKYEDTNKVSGALALCDLRDIWIWWSYSGHWKNRRRVWRCVVHATATARDADWW